MMHNILETLRGKEFFQIVSHIQLSPKLEHCLGFKVEHVENLVPINGRVALAILRRKTPILFSNWAAEHGI